MKREYKNLTLKTIVRVKEVATIIDSYCIDGKLSKSLQDIYTERIQDTFFIGIRTYKRYISFAREYLGYNF